MGWPGHLPRFWVRRGNSDLFKEGGGDMGEKDKGEKKEKGYKVKTFVTEVKIFQTMKELRDLDEQVNRFIAANGVKKVISISDTATTDNTGATIGLVRVLAYEA
jgi:hypothetical protein